jgi:hypothetical protein
MGFSNIAAELALPKQVYPYATELVEYDPKWAQTVCSWAKTSSDLKQISSEIGDRLTPTHLRNWVDRSFGAYLLRFQGRVIAFATASRSEWSFPPGVCEICHLLVAPEHRLRYHGSFFVNWLAHIVIGSGFESVVGRANHDNEPALRLMRYLRWRDVTDSKPWAWGPFRWFEGPAKRWS